MPEESQHAPSAAGTTTTGDTGSAGIGNTGNGQGTQPATSGSQDGGAGADAGKGLDLKSLRTEFVELGIGIGSERVAKKLVKRLGLDLVEGYGLEEVLAAIETRTKPAATPAPEDGAGQAGTKVLDHPEVKKLAEEHARAKVRLERLEKEAATLRGQADRAREVELSTVALSAEVGPGRQLDAFLRIYGDAVRYDGDRRLQVMQKLADGTLIPSGQTVQEYVAAAVAESPWLRRIKSGDATGGSGSRMEPARSQPATSHEAWIDQQAKRMGIKPRK